MRNYVIGCLSGWVVLLAGCTESDVFPLPDGSPLTVVAGIEGASSQEAFTRAVAENDYDRTTFIATDRIRITRTRSGSASVTVDYIYGGSAWTPTVADSKILFESGATYQAVYPLDYTGIRPDQKTADNYRLSNRLETPSTVRASNIGELSFLGSDQFKHKNVKLTLKFVGAVDMRPTADFSVEGTGLYSGSTTTSERVYPYSPGGSGTHDWHVIIAPGTTTSINVAVTADNGVSYKCTVSCGRVAGTNYVYTLAIQNNVLVPVGETIADWTNESVHNGGFTT